jgi:MFS family permease
MRGLHTDRTTAVVIAGIALLQNLRRGHYELATEAPATGIAATAIAPSLAAAALTQALAASATARTSPLTHSFNVSCPSTCSGEFGATSTAAQVGVALSYLVAGPLLTIVDPRVAFLVAGLGSASALLVLAPTLKPHSAHSRSHTRQVPHNTPRPPPATT